LQQLLTINLKWGSDHEKFQKFLISLFIWDLFTVVKGQGFENSIVDEVFSVYKIDQAPVIDGEMDDIWLQVSAISAVVVLANDQELNDAQDHSFWFKMLWNDSNLYFYFFVLDDNLEKMKPNHTIRA